MAAQQTYQWLRVATQFHKPQDFSYFTIAGPFRMLFAGFARCEYLNFIVAAKCRYKLWIEHKIAASWWAQSSDHGLVGQEFWPSLSSESATQPSSTVSLLPAS